MMGEMPSSYTARDTDEVFANERQQAGKEAPVLIGNVKDAVVQFKQIKGFTTFLAEYALLDGAYVVHFFPPRERYVPTGQGKMQVHGEFLVKWQRTFPQVLSPTAERYFQATQPRLQAAYTAEMFSWWFKAAGFADRLDPDSYIMKFFEELDSALDAIAFLA